MVTISISSRRMRRLTGSGHDFQPPGSLIGSSVMAVSRASGREMAGCGAVDWAIVVTGAVGLAGIGGTLLSARMTAKSGAENLRTSISAEDARANRAEKRRIYANYFAVLSVGFDSSVAASTYDGPADQKQDEIAARWRDARITALSASVEVRLIGSAAVASLATEIFNLMLRLRRDDIEQWTHMHKELMAAMRRDLDADDDPASELVIAPDPGKPGKLA
jgi:hypothetical protein